MSRAGFGPRRRAFVDAGLVSGRPDGSRRFPGAKRQLRKTGEQEAHDQGETRHDMPCDHRMAPDGRARWRGREN
jgi:hypothetical protein